MYVYRRSAPEESPVGPARPAGWAAARSARPGSTESGPSDESRRWSCGRAASSPRARGRLHKRACVHGPMLTDMHDSVGRHGRGDVLSCCIALPGARNACPD